MKTASNFWFILGLTLSAAIQPAGLRAAQPPVSFRAQIAPLLLSQCQTCHGPTEQKGGYRVDSFDFLSRNETPADPALTPSHPDKSALYNLLIAEDADERMPKKAEPLPKAQVELIKRWIAEGASYDGGEATASLVEIIPARLHPKAPEAYSLPLPVTALAFSPDGLELFASGLRELSVWNPADGKLLRRIPNLAPRTYHLCFSPDGSSLAAASGEPGEFGELRLFDPKSGAMLRQLLSSTDTLLDVKFSPDGSLLAVAGADHSLSIFELPSGRRRHKLSVHSDAVTAVAFSPDGTLVASVSLDRGAKVFNATTGKLVTTYREHQAPLYAVAFTQDGKEVLSAGRDKAAHQWNVAEGKKQRELGGLGDILKLLPNEDQIYLAGSAKKLSQAGAADLKPGRGFEGSTDWIYSLTLDPNTQRLAAGSYDGNVTVWNLADGKQLNHFNASPGYSPASQSAVKR